MYLRASTATCTALIIHSERASAYLLSVRMLFPSPSLFLSRVKARIARCMLNEHTRVRLLRVCQYLCVTYASACASIYPIHLGA